MKSMTQTDHRLEIQTRPGLSFAPIDAGMYSPAMSLARDGMISAAIERAYQIRIENYGESHGVRFRVVTTTRTVTVDGGDIDLS